MAPAVVAGIAPFTAFSLVHFSWVALFGAPALVPFTLLMAAFGAADGALAAALGASPGGKWAGPPLAFVVTEAVRARVPFGGVPWGLTGQALAASPLRRLAPFGGPTLMAVVVAGAAAALAAAVTHRDARWVVVAVAVAAAPGPLAALVPTGTHTIGTARVGVVQAYDVNRDPTLEEDLAGTFIAAHFELTSRLPRGLDLIAWGESSINDPATDPDLAAALSATSRTLATPLIVNAPVETPGDPPHLHNTTFVYGPTGDVTGTYVKRHLVPFGEFIPFRSLLHWVKAIERVPYDHVAGKGSGVLDAGALLVADLICFESADLRLARDDVRGGARILVVTTNNRSFSRSALSAQHVEVDRLLALTTGRAVVHAAVSGSSAVILPDGTVAARAGLFERATLVSVVPLREGRTLFVVMGDWVAYLIMAGTAVLLIGGPPLRGRLRRRLSTPGAGLVGSTPKPPLGTGLWAAVRSRR